MRSASTLAGTPPRASKHSANNPNVVAAVSSRANRTNRTLDHANTAQNTRIPVPGRLPQSITSVSPGVHTAGRRCRPCSARHAFFSAATSRRKFRAEPTYPTARASGNNRFAEIFALVLATRWATNSRATSVFFGTGARAARSSSSSPASWANTLRFTVFGSTPQISAAPRYEPTSLNAATTSIVFLAVNIDGSPPGGSNGPDLASVTLTARSGYLVDLSLTTARTFPGHQRGL